MARKELPASGIPEWLVTFADLMSILVCFFVLLISFSIQDQQKLQIVAGSMKDAFGILKVNSKSGVIERDGNPARNHLKLLTTDENLVASEWSSISHDGHEQQGPEANTFEFQPTDVETPALYSLAAASLKQAWADMPEITALSDNLIVQDTEEGLNIILADQHGRTMFPDASKYPYEATRKAIAAMTPALAKMPNQIRITGHTAAGGLYPNPRYGRWELSSDRANVIRSILEEFGLPPNRIYSVVGRGDAEPFFPNDPYLSTNQRISILLVTEKPPVPAGLSP